MLITGTVGTSASSTAVKVSGVGTSTPIPPRALVIFDIFDYFIHFLHHTDMTSKKALHSCVILEDKIATEDKKSVHVSFETITRGRPIHLIARHQRRVRTLRPIGPVHHTEHGASPAPLRSSHSRPALTSDKGTTFAGGWAATVVVVEWWFIISFLLPCSGRVTFGDFVVALVTVFLPVAGAFLFA